MTFGSEAVESMYVCICNAITDSQIREAARGGIEDLWGLQAELGVATRCGSCRNAASEILREHRELTEEFRFRESA